MLAGGKLRVTILDSWSLSLSTIVRDPGLQIMQYANSSFADVNQLGTVWCFLDYYSNMQSIIQIEHRQLTST